MSYPQRSEKWTRASYLLNIHAPKQWHMHVRPVFPASLFNSVLIDRHCLFSNTTLFETNNPYTNRNAMHLLCWILRLACAHPSLAILRDCGAGRLRLQRSAIRSHRHSPISAQLYLRLQLTSQAAGITSSHWCLRPIPVSVCLSGVVVWTNGGSNQWRVERRGKRYPRN